MFPFLTIFMIFIVVLAVCIRRNTQKEKQRQEAFWDRENRANRTRKKDLSSLNYIEIPSELSTAPCEPDETLQQELATLSDLSQKKIVNLNHYTNTDLKLKYGAANLPILMEYDENYTTLICTLVKIGRCLTEQSRISEAVPYLKFGVSCNSDITENYVMLAKIYRELHQDIELMQLYDSIRNLPSPNKDSILKAVSAV
ncbi:MAG: hypothetical protein ACI4DO_10405 [Roseburia sp.]